MALIKSKIVRIFKLGDDYRFFSNDADGCYEFHYEGAEGRAKQDVYRYVVNARGQEKSIETDPSELAANLLKSGNAVVEEHGLMESAASSGRRFAAAQNAVYVKTIDNSEKKDNKHKKTY